MAEELDDLGIPIRKSSPATEVDDLGIPIKKKAPSVPSTSPLITGGGKSQTGFEFSKPFAVNDKPIEVIPSQKQPAAPKVPKVHIDFPKEGVYKPINLQEQSAALYRQDANAPMYQQQRADNEAADKAEQKVINDKLEQYKKKYGNNFWGGVQSGMDETGRLIAKGISKGAVKLGTGILETADMVRRATGGEAMSAEDQAKNDQFYKTLDDNTNAGLPKDFHGSTALSRGVGSLAEFVPAMLTAEVGGGASFFFDGVGGADQEIREAKRHGAQFNNGADDWYKMGKGISNLLLMKHLNSHVLTAKLPSALVDDMAGRATLNAMRSMTDKGVAFTAENIAQAMKEQTVSIAQKIPEFLNKGAKAYAKTAADLSTLTYVDNEIKNRVNRISGHNDLNVQSDEQMAHSLKKILTEDAVVFAGLGLKEDVGALFSKSPYKNMVVESLVKDRSPENVKVVADQVAAMGEKQGWTPEDIDKTQKHVAVIGEAINKLPENFTNNQFNKGVDLITGRNDMTKALEEIRGHKKSNLDPAIASVSRPEEIALENKIDQANDKLKELATGKKYKYLHDEESGDYTKQIGEDKPEKITAERFNMEDVERKSRKEANLSAEQIADLKTKFKKPSDQVPAPTMEEGAPLKPREQVVARPPEVAQVEAESVHPPLNDAPVTESLNDGIYIRNGERGILKQDGQSIVFETKDKIHELGNIDQISDSRLSDFGIEKEQKLNVNVDKNLDVEVDGVRYRNEKLVKDDAINYDKNGEPSSVTLTNEAGQSRTIRGENAQEIIYQYKLKQFEDEATAEQINDSIRQADEAIRVEAETKPVDTKTADTNPVQSQAEPVEGGVARPEVPRMVPIEPREVRTGSIKRRMAKLLSSDPSNFVEGVAHFFLKGGKLSTEDFIRHTGMGFLKTKNGRSMRLTSGETAEYLETGKLTTGEKVKMSDELRMAKLRGMVADAKKGGLFADDIATQRIGEFGKDEQSIVEEIVDQAGRSREDILTNAERSHAEAELFGMTEKEINELSAEEYNQLTDLMNSLSDEEINGLTEGTRSEILRKVTERLNKKSPEELFDPQQINEANHLIDQFTDADGNVDWDGLEAEYYKTMYGSAFDAKILDNEPILKQIFENGYEKFNEGRTGKKSEANDPSISSESTGENTRKEPTQKAPEVEKPKESTVAKPPEQTEKERLLESVKNRFKLTDEEAKRKKELANKFRTFNDVTRIPTLVADKEFREYAGLVLKEAVGDFAAFSDELINNIGEGIRSHLPKLYKDLGGKEDIKESPAAEAPLPEVPKVAKSFDELAHRSAATEEVRNTLNNVERETGRDLTEEETQYKRTSQQEAFAHGNEVVQRAINEFGEDDYAMKLLDYIKGSATLPIENKASIIVQLENHLEKRILDEPENENMLNKQLKLVREYSTAQQRSAAIAVGFGIFRQAARVGYDTSEVTNKLFTFGERAERTKVEKAMMSLPDDINKAADAKEAADAVVVDEVVSDAVQKGVEKQIQAIYEKLPTERRKRADIAIAAIERFQKTLRGKAYDAAIGLPIAIIDSGLTTIKYAIKAGVKIADAIEMGIAKIKEQHGKEWAKEDEFRKDMHDHFKSEDVEVGEAKKKPVRKPLTDEQKLKRAKEYIQKRIDSLKDQIANKQRELKLRGEVKPDAELEALRAEADALTKHLDKEVPRPADPDAEAKRVKAQVTRLENEVESLDQQILNGEKDARAKKKELNSPELERLRAERQARLQILEAIDPTPKNMVKEALIAAGFGRDITVKLADGTKEVRSVLDWRKLAGDEGSVDKIRARVEQHMRDKGYTSTDIARMENAFVEEYNDLRASIIEKSINELNARNTQRPPINAKTSARRLAELYNLGLFDKQHDTYDYLMNNALGINDIGQEAFFAAKTLAKGLSDYFMATDSQGRPFNQSALKHGEMVINKQIEEVLSKVVWNDSSAMFKAATIVKEYIGMAQRSMLVSLPQAVENTSSGYIARLYNKIGYAFDKTDTGALVKHRKELAQAIFKDITMHIGIDFGGVNSPFIAKSRTMELINKASDSQLYHLATSIYTGRAFLESADSMHKVALTEKFFVHNLIKVAVRKGMKKSEALNFVSETLTGQSFENAKTEAKKLIDKVNLDAGKKIIPDNPESVIRLANDIVKEGLIGGNRFKLEEVEASFKAAYHAAGFELGHEVNNPISLGVSHTSSVIQNKLNRAIKQKEWTAASMYTGLQISWSNILSPFVGGGTNWAFLAIEKAGIPTPMTLYYNLRAWSKEGRFDIDTEDGMRNLAEKLKYQQVARNANQRVFIGALTSLSLYGLVKGTGTDDTFENWLSKNKWGARYFKKVAPPVLQFMIAQKEQKVGEMAAQLMNIKAPAFDEGNKAYNALKTAFGDSGQSSTEENKLRASGAFGDLLGSRVSTPIVPYRLASDAENVYRGLNGLPQRRSDFKTSGFLNGYYKGGLIDFLGLRPQAKEAKPMTKEEALKKLKTMDIKKIIEAAKAKMNKK